VIARVSFQLHGHCEPSEAAYGEKGDAVHRDRHMDHRSNPLLADAALLHHVHAELYERRGPRHLLQRLAGPEQRRTQLR